MRKGTITALLGATALSMMLATTGCGGGSDSTAAGEVGKQYIKAAKEGRLSKVKVLFTKSIQSASDNPIGAEIATGWARSIADIAKQPVDDKTSAYVDGDFNPTGSPTYIGGDNGAKELCDVDGTVPYKAGDKKFTRKATFHLLLEDGSWKMMKEPEMGGLTPVQ